MNEPKFYVDGELYPASEATVSVNDRGFKYGDAAFETLRSYNGVPFAWTRHFDRLDRTCELLSIDHGLDSSELRGAIDETLAANEISEAYIRLSITRGSHAGKLTPPSTVEPTLVIIVSELPRGGAEGAAVWEDPATASIVDTVRMPDESIPAAAKTHNYLNGIIARLETEADEALMLDSEGALTEGATSNLFFCVDGTLKTPSLDGPVLPGITREVVLKLATDLDIPTEVGTYTPDDLHRADEAFFTNTTWELRPITRVDDTRLSPGSMTEQLSNAFKARVEERYY